MIHSRLQQQGVSVAPASFRMIPVLAGLSPSLALKMEGMVLTALAGKTLGQGCLNASEGGGMGSADRTLAGRV
jgi:hypothetical protein